MTKRHKVLLYTIDDVSDHARECARSLGAQDQLELVSRTHEVFSSPTAEELDGLRKAGAESHAERIQELSTQADVLSQLLPRQLEGADLEKLADSLIAELGATSKRDMGKVMGALTKATNGNFDKPAAAAYVGSKLS